MQWSQFDPLGGLRGMLGVALPLSAGLLTGNLINGVIAASGALALGMGSFQKNKQVHPLVIFWGGIVMALSTLLGTLGGHSWALAIFLAGVWGFTGGLLGELNLSLSFVGTKAILAVLIAGGFPSDLKHAALRSLLVLSGGLAQSLLAVAEGHLREWLGGKRRATGQSPSFRKTIPVFFANLKWASPLFQGALRLGAALAAADGLSRFMELQKAYWLPLTVLIVLRPDFNQTFGRGLARMAGTLAGVALASGLTLLTHPTPAALIFLILSFAWLCFTFFAVNYTLFAMGLTAYVVFMVNLAGMPEPTAAMDRVIATLTGGFFAMLVFVLWPVRQKK